MSTQVNLVGRIGQDPELKFGNNGKAIARFSVVTSRRVLNRDTNEWSDEDTTWWNCTAFGPLAENIAESLTSGCAVIVAGRTFSESWNDKNTGEKRTAMKVIADDVAASLKYATAKVTKAGRSGGSGGSQRDGGNSGYGGQGQGGRQQQSSNGGGWGGQNSGGWGSNEEAPF